MKAFLFSYALFMSAFLWSTTYNNAYVSVGAVNTKPLISADVPTATDCIKDIVLYCDYNTSFSNESCWKKANSACSGNPAAMRDISEAAKHKSLNEVQSLTLD